MLHNGVRGAVSWRKTWVMSARGYGWKQMPGGAPGPYTYKVWVDIWAASCAFRVSWNRNRVKAYESRPHVRWSTWSSRLEGTPPRKSNGYVEISGLTKDTAVLLCALSIGGARLKEHQPQETLAYFAEITMLVDMSATNWVNWTMVRSWIPSCHLHPSFFSTLPPIPCPCRG